MKGLMQVSIDRGSAMKRAEVTKDIVAQIKKQEAKKTGHKRTVVRLKGAKLRSFRALPESESLNTCLIRPIESMLGYGVFYDTTLKGNKLTSITIWR
jgi:hypothetical protein